jgi:uncharacterized membrane protein YraQ (UPF0718 family)
MWIAAITSCLAVAAGAALALGGIGKRAMVPLRSFALAAVVATVAVHLLPEALGEGGTAVLAVFALAALAPAVLARLTSGKGDHDLHLGPSRGAGLAVELAYVSLLLHKVTDGVALASALGTSHAGHHHWDVVLAVAGHTVPMAATVALAYRHRGARVAALRTAGLAVAMVAGGLVADRAGTAGIAPWLNAVAAGLLLHVVIHDLPIPGPRGAGGRLLELAAIAVGIALPMLAGEGHGHEGAGEGVSHLLADAAIDLALVTAPALALGLVVAAAVQTWGPHRPLSWLERPGPTGALRGALLGAPVPGCSCGVLPVGEAIERRGGRPTALVAFVLAAPVLGAETVAVTAVLLGWPLALLRVIAAIVAAMLVAAVAARVAPAHHHGHHGNHGQPAHHGERATGLRARRTSHLPPEAVPRASRWRIFVDVLDDLVVHTAPWLIAGVVVAAYAQALIPAAALAGSAAVAIALVVVIALPSHLCAAAALPLAAVLVGKGLAPGAALAGLMLGPIAGPSVLALLGRVLGAGGAAIAAATLVALASLVAWALTAGAAAPDGSLAALAVASPWTARVALAALTAMAAHTVWRGGLSSWVAALHGHHEHDDDGHAHASGHGHGHAHGDHDHHA